MHQVQLSIPTPCHEDWNQMTPTQQGRHCNACAKQVIDFSMMSDAQVLDYFTNIKNEDVCGRAYPDQLERAIAMHVAPKKRLFWKWNYITMLFLFFSKNNNAKAQGSVKAVTVADLNTVQPTYTNELMIGKMISTVQTINGTVKDDKGNPIPFASIIVKGAKIGVQADAKGNFSIKTDPKGLLHIGAVGYMQKEVALSGLANFNFVLTKLDTKDDVIVMAGMMIRKYVVKVEVINIEVKDNANHEAIDKATIIIKGKTNNKTDIVFTSGNGIYKFKKIQQGENFEIKIVANGYKQQIINVQANSFDAKEITRQVFLEKEPSLADYKKLDSIVVDAGITQGRIRRCTTSGAVSFVKTMKRTYADTLKTIVTKINGDLKIFPNPIQKGGTINLAFKLKETGAYHIQIVNGAGQMLLLKQLLASSKNYTEQVQTNASWSGGVYYVRLLDEKNKLISTNSFIIQ